MSERESQIQRETTVDVDTGFEASDDGATKDEGGNLIRSLYGRTVGSVLSTRSLGIALALTILGVFVFGMIPLLGIVGELLGIFAAGFLYGVTTDTRRYVELLVAGAIAGGGSALLSNVVLTLVGVGVPLVAFGLLGGALAAATGHYFGRDLRDGLTRDLA